MIEDLHRQVAELAQSLATQNLEMYCDIDGCNSESNFENPYHKPVLVWEQHVRDEWHEDLDFIVEFLEIYGTLTSLTIVSKSQAHLPNSYYMEEEDEFIEEDCSVDWTSPPIYDIYPGEDDLLEEVNLFLDTINIVEEMSTVCLTKVQKVKYLNGILRKLIMLTFLGLKIFFQLFLNKILTLVSAYWRKF
jgi:hypothetical protein